MLPHTPTKDDWSLPVTLEPILKTRPRAELEWFLVGVPVSLGGVGLRRGKDHGAAAYATGYLVSQSTDRMAPASLKIDQHNHQLFLHKGRMVACWPPHARDYLNMLPKPALHLRAPEDTWQMVDTSDQV